MISTKYNLPRASLALFVLLTGGFILFALFDYFKEMELESQTFVLLLFASAVLVMTIRFKVTLLYLLALLIPLSLQLRFASGSEISIPTELICIVLSGFFIFKLLLGHKFDAGFLKHPITIVILLDLAWLFASSCFSGMPLVSFKRFTIRLLYYITFYYFFYELFRVQLKNISKVYMLQVVGLLIPIGTALLNHYWIGFSMMGSQRTSAPFYFDHTIFGAALVFFIPFLLYSAHSRRTSLKQYISLALLLLFAVATILSFSRAAWLSLLVALIMYALFYFGIKLKYLLYLSLIIGGILIINSGRIIYAIQHSREQSHTNDVSMHLRSVSNISTDPSNLERINRWKCAFRMFAAKPVFGFGPGTYQFYYGSFQRREDLTRISTFSGNKGHAHSEYLNYLSETGLPGFVIFVLLVSFTFSKAYTLTQRLRGSPYFGTTVFVSCGLLSFFLHAFLNGFLEFDKIAMPVFSSIAALVALDRFAEPQQPVKT